MATKMGSARTAGETRVAIYARTAQAGHDRLVAQEGRCRAHAAAHGWAVVGVWTDAGSGRDAYRTGLRGAMAMLRAGVADAVLATDAARLARDPAVLAALLDEAADTDGRIELLNGPTPDYIVRASTVMNEGWPMTAHRIGRTESAGAREEA